RQARRLATCGGREVEVIAMRRLGVIAVLGALLGIVGGVMTAPPALARNAMDLSVISARDGFPGGP
ncbi:MAG TPA: hypothetical protein VNO54_26620, partial [Streptosporangiaceae bacterium]|nr:hypothetical protein [Streptosporangiaceae bacterium]